MSVKYWDFRGRTSTEILKYFIRDFCSWELIHEIGVINSGVKSVTREVVEGQDPESLVLFLQEGE